MVSLVILQPVADLKWKRNVQGKNSVQMVLTKFHFVVKCANGLSGVVDSCIGGVQVTNVLIYSMATCNMVDRDTWESLKQEGA